MARLVSIMLLCFLSACVASREDLRKQADGMAQAAGMQAQEVRGGMFTLLVYERIQNPAGPVHVYIEGDGRAWITRNRISPDPTPFDPVGLTLALNDNAPNVAYMARPCQYIMSEACGPKYWSVAQFNESVIASINEAMNRWHGHPLSLIGYSGGAGVAMLVAARRDDVVELRTVAGNIDSAAFTAFHHVSPLSDSLNPASGMPRTAMIPQRHFVGAKDSVVPPSLIQQYQARLPAGHCSAYDIVPDINHYSGWDWQWPALLARPLPCATANPKK